MTATPAASRATEPVRLGPPRFQPGGRALFGAGYAVAAAVTALGVWLAASAPATGPVGVTGRNVLFLLSANLVLIGVLAAAVGLSVLRLVRNRRQDAGARLHLRFASLFAVAAVAPAIVVALFFGLLVTRGVDSWFSSRVRTVVDNHAGVANLLLQSQTGPLESAVAATAVDLGRYASELRTDPAGFSVFLNQQAEARGFTAVQVLAADGRVLAQSVNAAERLPAPAREAFGLADQDGSSFETYEREDLVRVLFPLSESPDVYVYLAAPLPAGMLARLRDSEQAVIAYREAEAAQERGQAVFGLSYAETALLVLVGAVWLGLAMATSISRPIAGLVKAAERVSDGDLKARVQVQKQPEELATLSRAFNKMTEDLHLQQDALRAAGREAEVRRQFIETVLSEVSAGVLSLDADGRISALNRQADALLGLGQADVFGRAVADVAPEMVAVTDAARRLGQSETELDVVRDGETRRLSVGASRMTDGGLVLTFDDVTRLVAAQRVAAWKDVARRIAHEIKNPLTPIQLSAERLRRRYRSQITGDLETFDRCTDTIIRQVGDIGRMVDEFSAFARMPAPRFSIEDPAELLRRAAFAQRVATPDIAVILIEPEASEPITCDARMVSQALINVLKNASEAIETRRSADPSISGRITARMEQDANHVCFIIEDNGIGLPAKDRGRLTEPYVTTREKGTGLGLAIVTRVMEDHGGTLVLSDAAEPPGARATLKFPRQARAAALAAE